eukprot:scaffold60201_cov27-Phaeocystis_antarctica.AAC.1
MSRLGVKDHNLGSNQTRCMLLLQFSTRGERKRPRRGRGFVRATRDHASSAEIIATWPYAPAGGMAPKTTHERYLGHRRSSQSEELTTITCIAPPLATSEVRTPKIDRCDLRSRELSGDQLDFT